MVNGVVYIGAANGLYAVNATTGQIIWKTVTAVFPLPPLPFDSSPTFGNGEVYVGSDAGFFALDSVTVEAIAVTPEGVEGHEVEELARFLAERIAIAERQSYRELVEKINERRLSRVLDLGFAERGKEARERATVVERAM